jgi:hypothetical protein
VSYKEGVTMGNEALLGDGRKKRENIWKSWRVK